jgi:hypothetical protein
MVLSGKFAGLRIHHMVLVRSVQDRIMSKGRTDGEDVGFMFNATSRAGLVIGESLLTTLFVKDITFAFNILEVVVKRLAILERAEIRRADRTVCFVNRGVQTICGGKKVRSDSIAHFGVSKRSICLESQRIADDVALRAGFVIHCRFGTGCRGNLCFRYISFYPVVVTFLRATASSKNNYGEGKNENEKNFLKSIHEKLS